MRSVERITVKNDVAMVLEEAVDCVHEITSYQGHPFALRGSGHTSNLEGKVECVSCEVMLQERPGARGWIGYCLFLDAAVASPRHQRPARKHVMPVESVVRHLSRSCLLTNGFAIHPKKTEHGVRMELLCDVSHHRIGQ